MYVGEKSLPVVLGDNFAYGWVIINLLRPTGHVMHHQFNIQQL